MLAVLPRLYRFPAREPGVHATARLGRGVSLGVTHDRAVRCDRRRGRDRRQDTGSTSHVVVGAGVVVGSDSRIFPSVTLYSGITLGACVVAHAGVRLGSDGFGYVFERHS